MKDKVRGAIVGVAIGDALGMPAESLNPKTIEKYYKWIESYRTPNPKTGTWHKLKRGQWTDDTQLTIAIGESIVRKNGIDFNDMAESHINAFRNSRRGWGKATIQGCQKMMSGTNWWQAGNPNAAGNGPPMKIAPVGVLYGLDKINHLEMINACINISKMTHGDPRAIIGAILQAYLIGMALKVNDIETLKGYILQLDSMCAKLENADEMSWDIYSEQSLTFQIDRLDLEGKLKEADDSSIRKTFGARAFINESLPFTYAMILKYGQNLKICMEHIINQGGDSDTTGAMAGAILGAFYGYSKFPKQWRWRLEDRARLVKLADNLYEMSKTKDN